MKKLLIIKGTASVGKSTAIKLAFERLLQWATRRNRPVAAKYLYVTGREVAGVITIAGIQIGLATRGDTRAHVEEALSFFREQKCMIVVCATRTRGSIEAARDFARELKAAPEEWEKTPESTLKKQGEANEAFAELIRKWVKHAFKTREAIHEKETTKSVSQ